MASIRSTVKKSLVTVVTAGMISLGAVGVAGAATSPATGTTPKASRPVHCAGVQSALAAMRHRQAVLDGKVLKLSAADTQAVRAGKTHRAAALHRYLAVWQRARAHKISARFLRREAKLAALAGQCQAAAPSTVPSTAPPTVATIVPAGTATT